MKKYLYEPPRFDFIEISAADILTSSTDIKEDPGQNDGEWLEGDLIL